MCPPINNDMIIIGSGFPFLVIFKIMGCQLISDVLDLENDHDANVCFIFTPDYQFNIWPASLYLHFWGLYQSYSFARLWDYLPMSFLQAGDILEARLHESPVSDGPQIVIMMCIFHFPPCQILSRFLESQDVTKQWVTFLYLWVHLSIYFLESDVNKPITAPPQNGFD